MRIPGGSLDGRLLAAVLFPAILGAGPIAAQQEARGIVRDGVSGTPVAGAMVVLLDEEDRAAGRVLTSADGGYRLLVRDPGRYRLRVDRIGYASTLTGSFDVDAGETVRLDVTTAIRPVQLPAVEARGGRRCEARPAEGVATNRVWEEARKALAAAEWTAERELYRFSGTRYEREVASDGRRVLSERRMPVSRYSSQPFEAASAADLARGGFVRTESDTVIYFAPDASVLLSDAFLDTHCFTLDRTQRNGVTLIGLRFEPLPRRDLPEVAGVLWLDEAARLRSIEYHYVNLTPRLGGDDAGGELSFRGLPNGTWIVQDWRIRMPRLSAVRNAYRDTVRYRVIGFRDEGGEVARVATASGEMVAGGAPGGVLHGTVIDSLGRPAAGARVHVVGTAYDAVTGEDGAFHFPDVGEGTWTVEASHAALVAVGHTGVALDVELGRGDIRRVELALPSARAVVLARCHATPPGSREVVAVGRVVDADGAPAAGADVRVLWTHRSTLAGGRTLEREAGVGLETDPRGTYVVCQAPAGHTLRLSAMTTELVSDTVEAPADSAVVAVPDLLLQNPPAEQGPVEPRPVRAQGPPAAPVAADSLWLESKGFWLRTPDAILQRTRRELSTLPRRTTVTQIVSRAPGVEAVLQANGKKVLRLRSSNDPPGRPCELGLYVNGSLIRQRRLIGRAPPSAVRQPLAQQAERTESVESLSADDFVRVSDLTGVEVFDASDAPVGDPDGCGAVLLWVRDSVLGDDSNFAGTLRGAVSCSTGGVPLSGVNVHIEPGAIQLLTDEHGRFERRGLPPARYHVRVDAPEWGTWSTEVRLRAGSTAHVGAELEGRCGGIRD